MERFYKLCICILPLMTFQLAIQADDNAEKINKEEILETLKNGSEYYICFYKKRASLKGLASDSKNLLLKRYRIYRGNEEYIVYKDVIYRNKNKYLKTLDDFYTETKEDFDKCAEEYNQQKEEVDKAKENLDAAERHLGDLKRQSTDAAKRNCYVVNYSKLKKERKNKIREAKKALREEEKKLEQTERKIRPQKRFFEKIGKLYAKYCGSEEETDNASDENEQTEEKELVSTSETEDSEKMEDMEEIEGNLLENGNFNEGKKSWTLRKAPGSDIVYEPDNKKNKVLPFP